MNAARPNPIARTGLAGLFAKPEPRARSDAEPARTGGVVGGRRLTAVLATAVVGVLAATAHGQTPRFDLVGKLDGSAYSVVQAVTDDGRAGGFSFNSRGEPLRAFTWSPDGGRVDRSTPVDNLLQMAHMSRSLEHIAVWNAGSVNSYRHTFGGATVTIPSVFRRAALPGAISADGRFVAGGDAFGSLLRPFVWSEATGTRLLPARPGDDSTALGISDDGRFVVGGDIANNVGWIWDDEVGYTALPNAIDGGQYNTEARAVSLNGRTVIGQGAAEVAPGIFRLAPMRWIDGVPQSLGFIEGFALGEATGMSDDGSVIVGNFLTDNSVRTGFVWTAESGISLLSDYLTGMGVDIPATTLKLSRPVVSSNGQVFGGLWSIPTTMGQTQGFVAAIPGSGSSLIGVALSVAVVARRRRD